MHLVFVTSLVPDGAPATGYEIANAAIIDGLRRNGARVTVLGYTWPGKAPIDPENTVVLGAVDVNTDGAPALRKARWLGEALVSGLTFSSAKMRAADERAIRAALIGIGPYDGYVVNAVQLAGAFESVFADKPSLYVAHNVEYQSAEENAAAAASAFQRQLFRREAKLLRSLEARLTNRARFVFTLAEEDRAALGVAGDDRSAVLPLVTLPAPFAGTAPRTVMHDIGLIGTWSWQPNRIGLDWFLSEVTPHLDPALMIVVAGRTPADVTARHPGVRLVGRVPDAVEFVRGSAVVPLVSRAGSGVQLKTIETFELGLPSVATSRSLRGVGHVPANCIVADEPKAFAAALERAIAERIPDEDGAAFHRGQRAALDTAIARGLAALSATGKVAAA